jgi:hypothetical protein
MTLYQQGTTVYQLVQSPLLVRLSCLLKFPHIKGGRPDISAGTKICSCGLACMSGAWHVWARRPLDLLWNYHVLSILPVLSVGLVTDMGSASVYLGMGPYGVSKLLVLLVRIVACMRSTSAWLVSRPQIQPSSVFPPCHSPEYMGPMKF